MNILCLGPLSGPVLAERVCSSKLQKDPRGIKTVSFMCQDFETSAATTEANRIYFDLLKSLKT